ncbi:uncharacterized protein B0T15DRAFT_128702 [Chaetomium strumarium]|uniref:Uncharacterized protein n=1 Tax=Chaetomium strumarium TaxID=1170767 RepID=A0AAJ0H0A4_9PEZI|nr:hypothetical protein B0T15DRAFT_128702 [Chaetomium strumarium]
MYARFGSGAQAGAAERECSNTSQDSLVPPRGNADSSPTPGMQSGEYQRQHAREGHDVLQIPDARPPSPTNRSLPETSSSMSPGQTVERLACTLSKQYLQQGRSTDGQLQTQPTQTPSSLCSVEGLQNPRLLGLSDWGDRKIRDQSLQHLPGGRPDDGHTIPWLPISEQVVGEPIEVDEAYCEPEDDTLLSDAKRSRWRPSSQPRDSSSTRPLNRRLEDMISTGTQCNVRGQLRPIPTPSRPTSRWVCPPEPGPIEPDPDCAMPGPDLEVDDAEGDGLSAAPEDLLAMIEGGISLRDASGPGGIRKHMVGGIALQYRLSADAALRCRNVVRNRPRMRKRHKTRHGSSAASSAVTSALNSPVMSSAASPPLPSTHPHPP